MVPQTTPIVANQEAPDQMIPISLATLVQVVSLKVKLETNYLFKFNRLKKDLLLISGQNILNQYSKIGKDPIKCQNNPITI
jgi:hypothetical protein